MDATTNSFTCFKCSRKFYSKYHLLLHYPIVIRNLGPPRFYWCMRYEAFHRQLKQTANSVTCRKNLLVTLSLKQQLKLSGRLSDKRGFQTKVDFGPRYVIPEKIVTKFKLSKTFFSVSWITINNILYKKDFALQLCESKFGQIKNIFTNEKTIYFMLQPLKTVGFCEHVQAFEIIFQGGVTNAEDLFVTSFDNMTYSKQVHNFHFSGNGTCFISVIK